MPYASSKKTKKTGNKRQLPWDLRRPLHSELYDGWYIGNTANSDDGLDIATNYLPGPADSGGKQRTDSIGKFWIIKIIFPKNDTG